MKQALCIDHPDKPVVPQFDLTFLPGPIHVASVRLCPWRLPIVLYSPPSPDSPKSRPKPVLSPRPSLDAQVSQEGGPLSDP